VLATALATLTGCAPRSPGAGLPAAQEAPMQMAAADTVTASGPPVIQVRDYPAAASVSVVGWSPEETAYGLHARVARDGTVEGGYRRGDHRLYLSTIYVTHMGGFLHAVAPSGKMLPRGGVIRDVHACDGGDECAPRETIGVSIPDELLRANSDSLVVKFYATPAREWNVTLRRDLIDAYLQAVDSVAASRRVRQLATPR